MANTVYTNFKVLQQSGVIDVMTDTIMAALLSGSYVVNSNSHTVFSDVSAHEVVGAGYTTSGKPLLSKTLSGSPGENLSRFDAADLSWTESMIVASGAVLFVSGSPAYLVGHIDFGADKTSSEGDFNIIWNAGGILTFT